MMVAAMIMAMALVRLMIMTMVMIVPVMMCRHALALREDFPPAEPERPVKLISAIPPACPIPQGASPAAGPPNHTRKSPCPNPIRIFT
jgi:hypothetical protein